MLAMNEILRSMPDDSILNMQAQNKNKKLIATFKLYGNLAHVLHAVKPSLVCAVSLRMMQITIQNGLGPLSPLSFVHYGSVLIAAGNVHEGCRLGKYHMLPGQTVIFEHDTIGSSVMNILYVYFLSLLLTGRLSLKHKSRVIAMAYF